jgi:hypothetical protein
MLNYQSDLDSLNSIYDCLNNIILMTKSPIKYLISTSILKITEDNEINWNKINENN